MKLTIKENVGRTDILDEKSFSVFGGQVYNYTISGDNAWNDKRVLDANGSYESIRSLLIELTGKLDGELPIRIEDFTDVHYSVDSSVLHLYYTTSNGEDKLLALTIYQNPCWINSKDLPEFGIIGARTEW